MASTSRARQEAAASRLEASDDILMRIMRLLTTRQRIRVSSVSKRWLRLAVTELSFHDHDNVYCAIKHVKRAAPHLVKLDVSEARRDPASYVRALAGPREGSCPLRQFISWSAGEGIGGRDSCWLFPEDSKLLRNACPLLDEATRLATLCGDGGVDELMELVDSIRGRHFLYLFSGGGSRESVIAALRCLPSHPRVAGFRLGLDLKYRQTDNDAKLTALPEGLAAEVKPLNTGLPGPTVEHLQLRVDGTGHEVFTDAHLAALASAAAERAARGGARASTAGAGLKELHFAWCPPEEMCRCWAPSPPQAAACARCA